MVDEAGKTMIEIVNAVKRVTDIMSRISAVSNEQSQGIEQINQAISQMDEVTPQSPAKKHTVCKAPSGKVKDKALPSKAKKRR